MATGAWRHRIEALERYASATRRRASHVAPSDAVALTIAAEQEANTAAFATLFGERITSLDEYLTAERSNFERFLHASQQAPAVSLTVPEAEYVQLGRDAHAVAAIRAEFEAYVARQEALAHEFLRPLAGERAVEVWLSNGRDVASAVRRAVGSGTQRFAAPSRPTLLRGLAGATAVIGVLAWSVLARGTDVSAAGAIARRADPVTVPAGPVAAAPAIPWVPSPVLDHSRIVALYGHPGQPTMGALGSYTPEDAAQEVVRLTSAYKRPGTPAPVGAFELIVTVAQATPTADGLYLEHLSDNEIAPYVEVARQHGLHLILDIQYGWGDPLAETKRYERFLMNPFVDVALDPEFGTKHLGVAPGVAIGSLDAKSVNDVEDYLGGVVRAHQLPKKLLILHQFTPDMLQGTADYHANADIERVIDMDGFGPPGSKLDAYNQYALAAYGDYPAIKLFFKWDEPMLSSTDLDALPHPPALIIYQ